MVIIVLTVNGIYFPLWKKCFCPHNMFYWVKGSLCHYLRTQRIPEKIYFATNKNISDEQGSPLSNMRQLLQHISCLLDWSIPLRVICQIWWPVRQGHVSVLRLRSHKWLKGVFCHRADSSRMHPSAASCPASNLFGKLQVLLKPLWPKKNVQGLPVCKKFAWNLIYRWAKQYFVSLENKLRAYKRAKYVKTVDEAGDGFISQSILTTVKNHIAKSKYCESCADA